MASIDLILTLERRPAMAAMEALVEQIALTHGPDVAQAWAKHALRNEDVDLFFRTIVAPTRPALRVVQGGKS